ncbi:unnamed protein product [Parascedosporium putredinis]|uniref:Uncharacterized protein n=1 Tax=Parascedosporium putredinis TaxID=1442378 RepID=A0A9P1M5T6_9PEZI|nr:unnamed protein product [Parascedosporium putredinis]CAI7988428.1 unnamed protein product [Parascedosporium putredinis]
MREEGEWDKLGALADLDEFFDAPYFRRGWIKQELVFRRGDHRIDGDILYAALQFHTRHWQYESMKLKAVTGKPLTPEIREKMEILLGERPGRDAANASLVARAKLHGTADEPPATLGTLIRRFRLNPTYTVGVARDDATIFSMPKDYVYGLLGLASDAVELRIPIHTSEDVSMEDVYVDATRRIIDAGDVDFLFLAHRTASHQSLPSWVADFRSISSVPHLTFRTISSAKPFSASLHRSQPARPAEAGSEDPMALSLQGILVDTVEKIGEIWPAEEHGDRTSAAESRKLEMQMAKLRPGGVLCNNYASSLAVSEVRRGFLGADGFVGIGPLEMRRGMSSACSLARRCPLSCVL